MKSLTSRLTLTAVTLVACVSILVAISATLVMRSYLVARLDDQINASMERTQNALDGADRFGRGLTNRNNDRNGMSTAPCRRLPPSPFGQRTGTVTALFSDNCRVGTHITTDGDRKQLPSAVLDTIGELPIKATPHSVTLPDLGTYRIATSTNDSGDTIAIGLPTGDVDETMASLIWWEVGLSLLGIAAAAVLGHTTVRRQLAPLRHMAATAHHVSTLELSSGEVGATARVPEALTDTDTEVGQVGDALNTMLDHIESALAVRHASEQMLRQFLADASHELRTPLTTIRGYAELSARTGADAGQSLAKVHEEAGRMSTLVEDMLLLARLDSGRPLECRHVDLSRLVLTAADDMRVVAPGHAWRLDLPSAPIEVTGDEMRLHQVITNLFTNAAKHTPDGTTITSTLRRTNTGTQIEIRDNGPGISEELLPKLFERFTRGDSSRTRASGGAGLGLSLVHAIVKSHGGTVTVTSKPGDTRFLITLPA